VTQGFVTAASSTPRALQLARLFAVYCSKLRMDEA